MSEENKLTMQDLNANQIRWCEGCGNFSIINSVKKLIIEDNLDPAHVANVSGIGCSSRAPHYINTYGINSIHGRAIPIATGLRLNRPDLDIIVHSGDGDAASIGGNHLLHGINKNINIVFIMYDNGLYSLTKSQTSPTTPRGHKTNTTPLGALIEPLNMIRFALGVGGSFVASTADWIPGHLLETLKKARAHKGFSFVHVWQRCPHFFPDFVEHSRLDAVSFLTSEKGISVPERYQGQTTVVQHDPKDVVAAFKYASEEPIYLGLFYQDESKLQYDELVAAQTASAKPGNLNEILDSYRI